MHRFIVLLSFAVAAALPLAQAQVPNAQLPNVVLIITDDVGYGDFGSYGAPDIKTPNVDGLARDGVRLTDFYANGATCTPTRAGLISGRYQQRASRWSDRSAVDARSIGSGDYHPRGSRCHNS